MNIKTISILDKSLLILILVLFAFIPLYPKFPLFNVTGTFVAIRIEDFLIAATLAIWTFYIIVRKDLSFIRSKIGKSILLYFFIGAVLLFSAIFLTHTVIPHLSLLHFLRRVEFMLLLPVCATVFITRKRILLALTTLFITLTAVNLYGLGQQYLDWPVIATTNSEFAKGQILRLTPGARINSTFAGHYDLAIFLNMGIVLLTTLFFAVNKRIKLLILTISALSLFILILTAARISFVAAVLGIIFALIFSSKKKYLLLVIVIFAIASFYPSQLRDRFVSTFTVNLLEMGKRYEGRDLDQRLEQQLNIPTLSYTMATRSAKQAGFVTADGLPIDVAPGEPVDVTELGVYRSLQIRLNVEWPRALKALLKNPFLGTGYSSLGLATDNDYLRSLGEVGILGTAAFALVLISVWKKIYQGIKREEKLIKYLSAGALAVVIVYLVNATFIDVFEASKVAILFWMILGLNLASLKVR